MHDARSLFEGKKITLLGLGLLGRGVGDAAFLASCGAHVTATDKKTAEELVQSVDALKAYPNITFHLGGHRVEDFTDADMVIKAAGVRLDSPEISAARAAGVPVYMSTALFAKYAMETGAQVVGVTGTRGKSTTTYLIHHCLENAFKKQGDGRRVFLGGNVRGVSTLSLMNEVRKGDVVVLELDSWQLQGFGDLHISPNIAVFTNLMPDHQNYYPDMRSYFFDKALIFRYQDAKGSLFVGTSVIKRVEEEHPPVAPIVPPALPLEWNLKVPGEHNRENAALAAAAVRALGISEEEVREGVETFEGVEGRLQFLREVNGVKIYNDNNATTPEATLAALTALDVGKKNIVLIMGGADKNLDMSALLYEVAKTCKRVLLLAGTGTSRIVPLMSDYSVYDDIGAAVAEAAKSAEPGDTILFSPAFASFGLFKNEYDRNDRFVSAVLAL